MTDQMARLQQEAEERWPIKGAPRDRFESARENYRAGARQGFLAGRTITAEQVERGAKASYAATGSPLCWEVAGKPSKQEHRKRVRAAFRAAGFYVEGEE